MPVGIELRDKGGENACGVRSGERHEERAREVPGNQGNVRQVQTRAARYAIENPWQ